MKIGILGSGDVARTLAAGCLKHGHQVCLGSRTPEKLQDFLKDHTGAQAGSFAEAAVFGEMLILAVKGDVAVQVLEQAGDANLAGKTVIDATNPIAAAPPEQGVLRFFTNLDQSLMEILQTRFPKGRFVKAFNSVGAAVMVNPVLKDGPPCMFIAGNDASAKLKVTTLLKQFGWEIEDMGEAAAARAIEPLCMLWCIPGFLKNEWFHALKVLR